MDVFVALEERIEKLIAAYTELRARVTALEADNHRLRSGDEVSAHLSARIAELEAERAEVRARLDKLLKNVSALEL